MPSRTNTETKYTAFRCPLDLLALAKIAAKKERRTLSNYVVCLIERDTKGMELPFAAPKKGKRSR